MLVVDDEPRLAKVIAFVLERHHEIHVATHPSDALRRITGGERFDLILSDLMMPELTGMELYAAVMRVDADQADRMVFMSGNAFHEPAARFLRTTGRPLIEKPFDEASLVAFVERNLRD